MGNTQDVEIIEEAMAAEEWYWVKFSYTDENGNRKTDIDMLELDGNLGNIIMKMRLENL